MTAWQTGRAEIAGLLERKHLERISGGDAHGTYLLQQAHQHLAGARAVRAADHIWAAFELAHGATRQAVTALLVQQGLRPTTTGGDIAVAAAAAAQFGTPFRALNKMRQIHNQLEYSSRATDTDLLTRDTERAITAAHDIINAAEKLLPELELWQ